MKNLIKLIFVMHTLDSDTEFIFGIKAAKCPKLLKTEVKYVSKIHFLR
jgi:hypothetical protein